MCNSITFHRTDDRSALIGISILGGYFIYVAKISVMVMKAQSKCLCSLNKVFPATAQSSALPPLCGSFQTMFVHRQIWCHCNPQAHLWRKKNGVFRSKCWINQHVIYAQLLSLKKRPHPWQSALHSFRILPPALCWEEGLCQRYTVYPAKKIYTGITQIKLINFN